ncbi:sigma 54-interacting transcriptional regulator [Oscillibacter sp.]|jgi:transcriptional regulator with PAS, ATPase and Fis domain|uniref:sigma-54-dependent Fis family transcriptional regulator n=1 Tax=Oscillibacter sp. TaxID=1945593 RepID=UPI00217174F2|nr:sigma 54-interacting transcriptional regulator [Oscillibacter sp.]MCI9239681.1 sigma 54-interacting transcriptional regulator [Oscillibacter sp.]
MDETNLFSKEYLDHVRKAREQYFQTGSFRGITGVRSEILACWEESYRLCKAPDQQKKGRVPAERFLSALEASKDLVDAAEPYMNLLHGFLKPNNFWVTLMDNNGIILKLVGSSQMIQVAHSTDLYEGSYRGKEDPYPGLFYVCWQLDRPFQIVSTEHPSAIDDNIAGAGAPIHEIGTGRCLGVIGISGYWWNSHDHTLGLTILAAEAISQQMALKKQNKDISDVNHKLNTTLEAVDAGAVYFREDGVIHAANRHAIDMLCQSAKEKGPFTEKKIFDYFDETISQSRMDDIAQEIREAGEYSRDLVPKQKYNPLLCTIRRVTEQPHEYFMQLQKCSDLNRIVTERAFPQASFTFLDIIGNAPVLRSAIDAAQIAARHNTSVLITGESGTGKEMFAQAIHNASPRVKEPFVAINCGAIPKSLIESELFGYEPGAFTGAQRTGHLGKFELANKGTIFLDEIGDMPYETQIALLRVLQTKEVVRVGGKKPVPVDVRVIAATNRNLNNRILENTFRQDLYYRLNVLNIQLPALRERISDIILLSNYFIQKYERTFDKRVNGISPEALVIMQQYPWPGNVRELENTIERAVIVCLDQLIQPADLPESVRQVKQAPPQAGQPADPRERTIFDIQRVELEELRSNLKKYRGNLSDVAKAMGVSRPTIYRKLKKYGLYPPKSKYEE